MAYTSYLKLADQVANLWLKSCRGVLPVTPAVGRAIGSGGWVWARRYDAVQASSTPAACSSSSAFCESPGATSTPRTAAWRTST